MTGASKFCFAAAALAYYMVMSVIGMWLIVGPLTGFTSGKKETP